MKKPKRGLVKHVEIVEDKTLVSVFDVDGEFEEFEPMPLLALERHLNLPAIERRAIRDALVTDDAAYIYDEYRERPPLTFYHGRLYWIEPAADAMPRRLPFLFIRHAMCRAIDARFRALDASAVVGGVRVF